MAKLIASIVVYRSDLAVLAQTLACLHQAGMRALAERWVEAISVVLIDNASGEIYRQALQALAWRWQAKLDLRLIIRPGNGGYGRGHNEVPTEAGDFRLVLNPDVYLAPHSLVHGLRFLYERPEVGLVVPKGVDGQGRRVFLCKRYPSMLVLGLRGFAPGWLKRCFAGYLARYEMRDLDWDRPRLDLELVSGCCLLMRGQVWQQTGGFCPDYFMYFEDFDFSLRARTIARIAYVPGFQVTHLGGGAARKGWRHRVWFLRSAVRFFQRYGWQWI